MNDTNLRLQYIPTGVEYVHLDLLFRTNRDNLVILKIFIKNPPFIDFDILVRVRVGNDGHGNKSVACGTGTGLF